MSGSPVASPVAHATRRSGLRNWTWIIVGSLVGGACLTGAAAWLLVHANFVHDRLELIDDDRTWTALSAPCARLQDAGHSVDPTAPPTDRAAQLEAVVTAIDGVTATVRALPADALEDSPVQGWLSDWDAIAAELDRYASDLAAGADPTFEMPQTDDGYTITFRMNWAGPEECAVPAAVESLDLTPPPVPEG